MVGALLLASVLNCDPGQTDLLTNYSGQVGSRLEELTQNGESFSKFDLDWVSENFIARENREPRFSPEDPSLTEHTYRTYHSRMKNVFEWMHNLAARGYELMCLPGYDPSCARYPDRVAFIRVGGGNRIYICPLYFEKDNVVQVKTVFHELSHLAADTDDFAPSGGWSLAKIERNPKDAYHVERFAVGEVPYTMRAEVWHPLWKRKK